MSDRPKLYPRSGETPDSPEHLARRLANGVVINEETGCLEWQRSHNSFGYGTLTIHGRAKYAHRLAYELWVGPIPVGLHVMHSCDNPRCCNIKHLSVGTRSENMRDCHRKGRSRIPSPRMIGESNGAAKLSLKQVSEIRALLGSGESQKSIAARHGVSQSTVSLIKLGKLWGLTR